MPKALAEPQPRSSKASRPRPDGVGTDGLIGFLLHLAANHPTSFAGRIAKLLPLQLDVDYRGVTAVHNNRGKLTLNAPIEDAKNMLRKMVAEVLFLNPNDLNRGSAELIEHDFEVEYLDDLTDDYGPTVWVNAVALSELDDFSFLDWVQSIVEPVGGEVCEAGPSTRSYPSWVIAASWRQRA